MAIPYRVVKTKNPKDRDNEYFAGRAIKTSDYNFDDIADDIASQSTVSKADAMAVLTALKPLMKKALLAGRRVVLPELGAFQIGINGKCYPQAALTDEEFSPSSMIKGHRVHFRINPQLKKEVAMGFQLKRVSSEWME